MGKSCIDEILKREFDVMSADEFADYVASNPLDSPRILYYLSISSSERFEELFEGFSRHVYFNEKPDEDRRVNSLLTILFED